MRKIDFMKPEHFLPFWTPAKARAATPAEGTVEIPQGFGVRQSSGALAAADPRRDPEKRQRTGALQDAGAPPTAPLKCATCAHWSPPIAAPVVTAFSLFDQFNSAWTRLTLAILTLLVLPAQADPLAEGNAKIKVQPVAPLQVRAFALQDVRLLDGPFKHARELDEK